MQTQRIYGLDILRAAAILLVLLFHTKTYLSNEANIHYFQALPDGVSLFFVLSGFLIGRILVDQITNAQFEFQDVKSFWIRRWLRTLPAYYFVLIILIIHRVMTNSAESPQQMLQYFFFVQNVSDGGIYFFRESWSLSIEEWFYLLTPVLFYLSFKFTSFSRQAIVLFWIIAVIMACTFLKVLRAGDLSTYREWNELVRKTMVMRFDSIMFGVLAAYILKYKPKLWQRMTPLFYPGLLLILLPSVVYAIFDFNWFTAFWRLPLESIGTMLMLPMLFSVKHGAGLVFRVLTFTSMISYSLYLVNYSPVNEIVLPRILKLLGMDGSPTFQINLLATFLFLVCSFVGAWVLYRTIEKPFMALRNNMKRAPVKSQEIRI